MLNQYALLGEQENRDYSRYRDTVSDWNTERDYLTNRYDSERSYDYGKYSDERNFDYGVYADEVSNEWKEKEYDLALEQFAHQKEREAVADSQWQQQFDLSKNSGSGGSGGGGDTDSLLGGWSEKDFTSAMSDAAQMGDEKYAMALVIAAGRTATAYEIYHTYFGEEEEGIDTDVPPLKKGGGGSGGGAGKFAVHYVN